MGMRLKPNNFDSLTEKEKEEYILSQSLPGGVKTVRGLTWDEVKDKSLYEPEPQQQLLPFSPAIQVVPTPLMVNPEVEANLYAEAGITPSAPIQPFPEPQQDLSFGGADLRLTDEEQAALDSVLGGGAKKSDASTKPEKEVSMKGAPSSDFSDPFPDVKYANDFPGKIRDRNKQLTDDILKNTQGERSALDDLKAKISEFENRKEIPQIDFTAMSGLVDTLTGSNTSKYIKAPKREDKLKSLIDMKDVVAKKEAQLAERKVRVFENMAEFDNQAELEKYRRDQEVLLEKMRQKHRLDLEGYKAKLEGDGSKGSVQNAMSKLNSPQQRDVMLASQALEAVIDMEENIGESKSSVKAFSEEMYKSDIPIIGGIGNTANSFIGDTNFTTARMRYRDNLSRLQTGAVVNKDEDKSFLALAPTSKDSDEMKRQKLQNLKAFLASRIANLGIPVSDLVNDIRVRKNKDLLGKDLSLPSSAPVVSKSEDQIKDRLEQIRKRKQELMNGSK